MKPAVVDPLKLYPEQYFTVETARLNLISKGLTQEIISAEHIRAVSFLGHELNYAALLYQHHSVPASLHWKDDEFITWDLIKNLVTTPALWDRGRVTFGITLIERDENK